MATGTIQTNERIWKRLWTNASPGVDFAAQTVSIGNMGNYNEFRVLLSDHKEKTAPSLFTIIVGFGRSEQWCFNAVRFHMRGITTSSAGVRFENANTYNSYANASGTTGNDYLIPWYIEGR